MYVCVCVCVFVCVCVYAVSYQSAHSIHENSFGFTHMCLSAIPHLSAQPTRGSVYIVTHRLLVVSQVFSVTRHSR